MESESTQWESMEMKVMTEWNSNSAPSGNNRKSKVMKMELN